MKAIPSVYVNFLLTDATVCEQIFCTEADIDIWHQMLQMHLINNNKSQTKALPPASRIMNRARSKTKLNEKFRIHFPVYFETLFMVILDILEYRLSRMSSSPA